ncbi:MAG: hypothetical protein DSY89_06155, partial [Deltaproteobacteria bacterium]
EIGTGRAAFSSAAFGLKNHEVSDIIELGNDFCLLQLEETQPEAVPPLADVIDRVRTDWVKMRQDEKAREAADALLAELKKGKSMPEVGKAAGLSLQTTPFFKRNEPIPGIGSEAGISREAFLLTARKKIGDQVIKGQKGYYLIGLKERKAPDAAGFSAREDAIVKRLKGQKRRERYNAFLARLRKNSKIEKMLNQSR